uniref:glutathione transferase n=1 Tax=Sus scrofa TaxID=9823 RepID=A0A8D1F3G5_PIG
MAAKPKLYYFRGRGRMESIRWLLAAAGVEFEEEFFETREQYEKLKKDGLLLFGQVPLVEIDGMALTQTRAILSYLAAKYNLHGKDLKERVRIDMYADGTLDLMMMVALAAFKPPGEKEENLALVVEKAKTRYFPVFEKVGFWDPVWRRRGRHRVVVSDSRTYADPAGLTSTRGPPRSLPRGAPTPSAQQAMGEGLMRTGSEVTAGQVPSSVSQATEMQDCDVS